MQNRPPEGPFGLGVALSRRHAQAEAEMACNKRNRTKNKTAERVDSVSARPSPGERPGPRRKWGSDKRILAGTKSSLRGSIRLRPRAVPEKQRPGPRAKQASDRRVLSEAKIICQRLHSARACPGPARGRNGPLTNGFCHKQQLCVRGPNRPRPGPVPARPDGETVL